MSTITPDADLYEEIKRRFSFALPDEYRRMRERGWLEPTSSTYLWLHDMEWMPLKDICGGDPGFFQFARPGLIPFAFTGGADHWAWYPQHTSNGVTPVVGCPRDSEIGRFYAPSFLGAIYRRILDFACEEIKDERGSRQHLKRWFDELGPVMPDDWRETIGKLQLAPLRPTEWRALLAPEECAKLMRRDLAFPMLDKEFRWMVD